jgi:hypothetical protein
MGDTTTVIRITKKAKIGGSSKKGRQSMQQKGNGKYIRQTRRTKENKMKAWKKHLVNHPNDIMNQKNIKRVMG